MSSEWRSNSTWRGGAENSSSSPRGSGWRSDGRPSQWGGGRGGGQGQPMGGGGGGGGGSVDAAVAEGRRIYVGNLLYSVQPHDVEGLLADAGFAGVDRVTMQIDQVSGRNPGYCFVEFSDRNEADRALQSLGGVPLQDRPLKVGPCQPRGDGGQGGGRREQGGQPGQYGGGRSQGGWGAGRSDGGQAQGQSWGGGYNRGSPSQGAGGFGGPPAPSNRLYVGGLPALGTQEETEQTIQAIFNGFAIQSIGPLKAPHESKLNEPGNHYFCFVELPSADDAQAAIDALSGSEFAGGVLKINQAKQSTGRRERGGFGGGDGGRNNGGWRE